MNLAWRASIPLILCLAFLSQAPAAKAAACCGGTSAAPGLLTGDDTHQLTFSAATSSVIGDVPDQGWAVYRSSSTSEVMQTFRIDGAMLVSESWQIGLAVPLIRKEFTSVRGSDSQASLGDLSLTLAHETWPEFGYSAWKPRGFTFLSVNAPMAASIYETTRPGAVDAIGSGFWRISGGALFLKSWNSWDLSFLGETHYSFTRNFPGYFGSDRLWVSPGWGMSAALGAGWSFAGAPVRVGARFQPILNQGRSTRYDGETDTPTPSQLVWNSGLDVTWLASPEWSAVAAYTDQTWLGPAKNTTLSRAFAFNLQRRWPR